MTVMPRLSEAFQHILAHAEDRRMLAFLLAHSGEVRYEVARRGVEERSPQMFKYCVDRLSRSALINRRLVEHGHKFDSYLSLTAAGKEIARALVSLSERGALPRDLPQRDRLEIQQTFLSEVAMQGVEDDTKTRRKELGLRSTELVPPSLATLPAEVSGLGSVPHGYLSHHEIDFHAATPTKGSKGAPSKSVLKEAIRRIVDVAHPRKVILFGSAARGEMGPDSDLDFLVVVKGPAHRRKIAQSIHQNLFGVGISVDPVVVTEEAVQRYGDIVGTIIRPALKEGRVVYAA
jgi:predicted nucleotidyltransferase/DNA-binding MarR family transcriptional regulator